MVGYMAGAPMAPAVATETETPTEATTLRSLCEEPECRKGEQHIGKLISTITSTKPPYLIQSMKRIFTPNRTIAVLMNHSPLAVLFNYLSGKKLVDIT